MIRYNAKAISQYNYLWYYEFASMKAIVLILLIFACACNNPPAKKAIVSLKKKDTTARKQIKWGGRMEEVKLSSLDTITLLKKFFEPDTIINKIAIWKPDPEAKLNMIRSAD